jgi:hypothetical protein
VAIANEIGRSHVVVVRFLRGNRRPSRVSVLKINDAIGKLANHEDVAPFLDCEALLCELLDVRDLDVDALAAGAAYALERYKAYFKDGSIDQIIDEAGKLSPADTKRFAGKLNRAFRRVLIAELNPPTGPIGFATICEALEQCGFDVKTHLSEQGEPQLALERFEWALRRELALANPRAPASERIEAERRIMDALLDPKAVEALAGKARFYESIRSIMSAQKV